MQFFFLEKNIAGKGKGNKKCSNSTDDGANCCHRCIHKISRTISENTHPPLDCLIRIELHLVHKIHDFPVIVRKFPYPALHLRNKICNTVHQKSIDGIRTIAEKTEQLDQARVKVVDVVQNLTAIAEENAAGTEETSASAAEVGNTMTQMADEAKHLSDIANKMEENVNVFVVDET
mgnify:CR=1 FL=1